MPVNGIELKEGQIWTSGKRKVTLKKNESATTYKWKAVYENEEWDTIDENGIYRIVDGIPFVLIQNLIYDPKQPVEKENTMQNKFNPQPGDKIICNNGEEFICCTLEFLQENIAKFIRSDKPILGYRSEFSEWQDWDEHGKASDDNDDDYDIREVIPQSVEVSADKKEEVKEEPRYNLQEIKEAWDASAGWDDFKNELMKINNPQYQEYLRLKAIYE